MNKLAFFLDGPFVEALGWTLLHSLWQGALVMIILAVILGLTQGRNSHIRYGFSVAALMLMLLWSGMTFMSYYTQPVESTLLQSAEWTSPSPEVHIAPAIVFDVNTEPIASSNFNIPFLMEKLEGFMHANSPFIAAFWLFGSMLFFLKWLGSLIYIHRIRRTAITEISSSWQKKLDRLAKRMGILRGVKLVESIRVHTPMVVGHFKPLILVPVGLLTGMNPDQIETILIHELAHIRRNDYIINLIQSVLEVIYFYHPAYWWIADKIRQEREHCCDDIAVAVCGNAMLYARALTEVQAKKYEAVPALALAATGKKNHLMNRIKRLLVPAQERANMAGKVILSFILLLSVWSFAWVEEIPQAPQEDQIVIPQFDLAVEVPSFEVPDVIVPDFDIQTEPFPEPLVVPEAVPEPTPIPGIEPIEVPEAIVYSAPFPEPEIAEVFPENGSMRFNFQFPDITTSLQHFFQFSFAVVDTPKPFIYRFAPPPPGLPPVPPLPEVDWDDQEAKRAYEDALRAYKLEQSRIQEEQARWYEEARRMQEEYARMYEKEEELAGPVLRKLEQEILLQRQLAELKQKEALIQAHNAERALLALEKEARVLSSEIEKGEVARLKNELNILQNQAKYHQEKAQRARTQAQKAHEDAEIARAEAQVRQQLNDQRKYEELMRKEMAMQKMQVEEQMRQTERQMHKMEQEMRKQEAEMNRRIERLGKEIKTVLIKDGYIDSMDENLHIQIQDDFIKVNGRRVKDKHYRKYVDIMEEHDLQFGKGSNFTIQF